jgi:uncharacterized membrane protein (DUF2068 family)
MNWRVLLQCLAAVFLGLGTYRLLVHPEDREFALLQIAIAVVWLLGSLLMARTKEREGSRP